MFCLEKSKNWHIRIFLAIFCQLHEDIIKLFIGQIFNFLVLKTIPMKYFGCWCCMALGWKQKYGQYFAFPKIDVLWVTQMLPIFVGWWKFFKNCLQKWKRSDGRLYCDKLHFHTLWIEHFRLFSKSAFFPKKVIDQYILHLEKVHFT